MLYIISAIIILLAGALLIFSGCRSSSSTRQSGNTPSLTRTVAAAPSASTITQDLTRDEIVRRLQKLSESSPPTDLKMGACCYDMAAPPDRVDYVCPACGEKTLYAAEGNTPAPEGVYFIQDNIAECRRLVNEIKGLDIKLDESEFCRKCSPGISSPQLTLIIKYPGEKEPYHIKGINKIDLLLLWEFLQAKDRHQGDFGEETPLSDHSTRLRKLLNVNGRGAK